MKKVTVLVGMPGVGKSTWAKQRNVENNVTHLSSDNKRLSIYGSLKGGNGKEQNTLVFKEMNEELQELIKSEEPQEVIYDATNLNRKRRRGLYRNIKGWNKDTQVNIVYFSAPYKQIQETNKWREVNKPDRCIPESKLKRMYINMQVPRVGADCDSFHVVGGAFFDKEAFIDLNIIRGQQPEQLLRNLVDSSKSVMGDELEGIYQPHDCSPWHEESIDEHIEMCLTNANNTGDSRLTLIALFHDLGKAMTKEKVTKDGTTRATYRGHAELSANYMLNYLTMAKIRTEGDMDLVEATHQHMNHHNGIGDKNKRNNKINDNTLDLLEKFGIIDTESRIVGGN